MLSRTIAASLTFTRRRLTLLFRWNLVLGIAACGAASVDELPRGESCDARHGAAALAAAMASLPATLAGDSEPCPAPASDCCQGAALPDFATEFVADADAANSVGGCVVMGSLRAPPMLWGRGVLSVAEDGVCLRSLREVSDVARAINGHPATSHMPNTPQPPLHASRQNVRPQRFRFFGSPGVRRCDFARGDRVVHWPRLARSFWSFVRLPEEDQRLLWKSSPGIILTKAMETSDMREPAKIGFVNSSREHSRSLAVGQLHRSAFGPI